jgi:predicted acetyltransferase
LVDGPQLHWGVADASGRLIARASDRPHQHWFGGRLVPASGLAGVAVAPEARGQQVAGAMLGALLAGARERGASVSALYRTLPGVYRRLGWEDAGSITYTAYPTLGLARARTRADRHVRAATAGDHDTIKTTYDAYARQHNGMLDHGGPLFDEDPLQHYDGVTLVDDDAGRCVGYACWDRGEGYASGAKLTVQEFVTLDAGAAAALLASFGGWGHAVPTTSIRAPLGDPLHWALPCDGVPESAGVWMFRIIDAVAAFDARGYPSGVEGTVDLLITDEVCPWNAGPHRLQVHSGAARLERGGTGAVEIGARGLALLFAGGVSAASLRRGELISGGGPDDNRLLDGIGGGGQPSMLDGF